MNLPTYIVTRLERPALTVVLERRTARSFEFALAEAISMGVACDLAMQARDVADPYVPLYLVGDDGEAVKIELAPSVQEVSS